MATNYPRLISVAVAKLPASKQAQIYRRIKVAKPKRATRRTPAGSKSESVFDLFGSAASSVRDGAANHDKYLYG